MFNKICVLGCGLIGSSLLRAIDKKKLAKEISALNREDPIKPQPKTQILLNINNFP